MGFISTIPTPWAKSHRGLVLLWIKAAQGAFGKTCLMTDNRALIIFLCGAGVLLAAMLIGPIFAPPVFFWLRHTTSEQAGQHMSGAWIMRAGFVGYGIGTIFAMLLSSGPRPPVRAALGLFGLGLLGTAIWSNLPVDPASSGDAHEDWMHSVASGVVGTAFAAACAARLFAPGGSRRDALSWAGLAIAVIVPLAMGFLADYRGLLQRLMFGFSILFILRELRQAAAT